MLTQFTKRLAINETEPIAALHITEDTIVIGSEMKKVWILWIHFSKNPTPLTYTNDSRSEIEKLFKQLQNTKKGEL